MFGEVVEKQNWSHLWFDCIYKLFIYSIINHTHTCDICVYASALIWFWKPSGAKATRDLKPSGCLYECSTASKHEKPSLSLQMSPSPNWRLRLEWRDSYFNRRRKSEMHQLHVTTNLVFLLSITVWKLHSFWNKSYVLINWL